MFQRILGHSRFFVTVRLDPIGREYGITEIPERIPGLWNIEEMGGNEMKKLEIVVKPEKLEDLKAILDSSKASGVMITNIMGYGNQKGFRQLYRGAEYKVNLLPKLKVETVVDDKTASEIIDQVVERINTGHYGDGKIFVYDVEDAVRIRTGERGQDAL